MRTVLQAVGFLLNVYVAFARNTRRIYLSTALFNLANLVLYFCMKDWPAVLTYVLITVRSFVYTYMEPDPKTAWRKTVPILFCGLHMAVGIASIRDPWQLLTVVAPVTVCLSMWFWKGQLQKLRVGNVANAACWLAYNLHTGLYIIALTRVATIVANLAALYRNRTEREGKSRVETDDR